MVSIQRHKEIRNGLCNLVLDGYRVKLYVAAGCSAIGVLHVCEYVIPQINHILIPKMSSFYSVINNVERDMADHLCRLRVSQSQ